MYKKIFALLLCIAMLFTACSYASDDNKASVDFFAMDTYMKITAYGDNAQKAVDTAEKEVFRLEKLLSTEIESSDIAKLNKNKSAKLSNDTYSVLKTAISVSKSTNGAFNPTVYPIVKLWGFNTDNPAVPKDSDIKNALKHIDINTVQLGTNSAKITDKNTQIDLGGIVKGYISAKVVKILQKYGVKSAVVNLGGNVQTLGTKTNGDNWNIGIVNPDDDSSNIGVLSTHDRAIITSGGYERNFEQNGKTYHHIIDPTTGYPANNGLKSVTVISKNATQADALSTALYVMGTDKAVEYYKAHKTEFDIVLVTDKNKLIVSQNLKQNFTSKQKISYV